MKLFSRIIKYIYSFVFARPGMQFLNDKILQLAFFGRGYNNFSTYNLTGETKLIKLLSKFNPKYCIDIGANKGNFSKYLLENTNSEVIAFEPLPKAFAHLNNLENEYPNRFTAINKGVGEFSTMLDLNFGAEDSEFASFSKEVNKISYVGSNNIHSISVEVIRMDDYFIKHIENSIEIDLLKIDTEGFEFEVLKGALKLIERCKPKFIQIEFNWHQLFKDVSLYKISCLLKNYDVYQLLPYGSGLVKRDVLSPEANIYHFSNFVFIRSDISI